MAAVPKPKFMMLGKSKFVHVVRTKTYDLKNSGCQQVRKFQVADNIPKGKGISPEAALALDPCSHCEPGAVIKSMISPEDLRKARKQATKDMLDQMRPEPKVSKRKPATVPHVKKSETGDKAPKKQQHKSLRNNASGPAKAQMTKSGPKSLGGDAEKAGILADFAESHGWKTIVAPDEPGYKLVARRGDETITCWFDGGKYDLTRVGYIEVKGSDWQGKLRAAHACRRQMAGEGRDRPHPHPGAGRSAPRSKVEEPTPETESPEDALKRVPFLVDDDDLTIIDVVKGKIIRWRNGVSGAVEEAQLPSQAEGKRRPRIAITTHPTKNRRILHFFAVEGRDDKGRDVFGPERSVAIEKIIRVL